MVCSTSSIPTSYRKMPTYFVEHVNVTIQYFVVWKVGGVVVVNLLVFFPLETKLIESIINRYVG